MVCKWIALLLSVMLMLAPAGGFAEDRTYSAQEIYAQFIDSVVHIESSGGGGTGFFIEENIIVTNHHVVAGAEWLTVKRTDGSVYDVTKIIASSDNPDLAMLEVSCSGVPLAVNTHGVHPGEPVYALGAPMGFFPCISDGIVMKSSHMDNNTNYILSNFHSIGGNSGGPVLNAYGELIGVVVGGYADGPNSIDMVIRSEYISLMDRSQPMMSLMTREEYMAEMNKPEEQKYEIADIATAEPGQLIVFGRYEQDNNLANGPEDIYWLVEEKRGGELVLMSLYCLDAMPYYAQDGEITWEHSDVRRFLNEEFFVSAFNDAERSRILTTNVVNDDNPVHGTDGGNDTMDKVYLPSLEEVMRYYDIPDCVETFYGQLYGCASQYTIQKGVWLEIPGSNRCWWWLRSPGGNPGNAGEVGSAGYLSFNGSWAGESERALRPMIRIGVQ